MKKFKTFGWFFVPLLAGLIIFSCRKEIETTTTSYRDGGECDYEYNSDGYVIQEDGIMNFSNADYLSDFIDTISKGCRSDLSPYIS